ncbi:zinc-binding dehydrogenase [Paenibacillus sp. JCM 10914]|uniref:zinc-dependent alcohol dehydrogenase n=1 Tax=Paenibacillus sp. JCM 10914 TaxID=1236974 RepID=UPI0003CC90BF|nr:zinc-binding alcohol dehydrogenase [Paenibacillus sp. JCM 10914]GAE05677.1 zinc-type alcohol dehydrogenase YcjQ [Paenibacillus sp. JCM 10914]
MQNKQIVFTAPWQVEVQNTSLSVSTIGEHDALVKKIYTLISPGTELACLSGNEGWFGMPGVPGYAAVSEIIEVGNGVTEFNAGDIVFHYGDHSAYQIVSTEGMFMKAPQNIPLSWVPFTRMATVAFTSTRISQIELGDHVAVTGLGLIGNMASQLAKLQGANVFGIDLSEQRLIMAEKTAISAALHAGHANVREEIMKLTGGEGVSTLIEATGVPKAAVDNLPLIAKFGELIFLGSPRGEYQTNVTEILNYVHLMNYGSITFKGAHEWRYPVEKNGFVKHSLVRNSQIVFRLMAENKLLVEPLISHVLKPEEAGAAYEGLRNDKEHYYGVLFDWS